jgi:hypothetical protein
MMQLASSREHSLQSCWLLIGSDSQFCRRWHTRLSARWNWGESTYKLTFRGFSQKHPKTTRIVETVSPVDSILAERGAKHININILRYFSEPATLDDEAKAFLHRGMTLAMEWAVQGLVIPHVGRTIDSTVEAINAGLQSLKSGSGTLGKVAVIVDRDLAEGS